MSRRRSWRGRSQLAKLEQNYEWEIKQLEKKKKDDEDSPVAEWWVVQSDYQPAECR